MEWRGVLGLAVALALAYPVSAGIMGEGCEVKCIDYTKYVMGRDFVVDSAFCEDQSLAYDQYRFKLTPSSGSLDATIRTYSKVAFNFTETPTDNPYVTHNLTSFLASSRVSVFKNAEVVDSTQTQVDGVANWENPAQTFSVVTNWSFERETIRANVTANAYINGFVNGSRVGYVPDPSAWDRTCIGRCCDATPSNELSGSVDEVRVSGIVRGENWIRTEYNNQASPDTFYTIGGEEGV